MLRYLSLFSGIGAFEKALTNLGVKYEVVNYCEIDKYASKSYSAIHGVPESKNLWDITKVNVFNLPKDIDLLTYGFPCQDISLAGKQKGMFNEDGSLTRSGLFFKALDVIEYVKPKIAIAENVKALTSKKFTKEFKIVLDSLEKAGYHNYWKVLNAKDYGIPQNRERVFIVSIRKDIDHNIFEFPKPYSLEKRLKDFLEPHVDEKYYLSEKMISKIVDWKAHQKPFEKVLGNESISPTLTARGAGENHSGMILYSDILNDTTNLQNECLKIKEKTKKGYSEAQDGDGVYINRPEQKRGVVQKGMIQTLKTSPDVGVVVKDKSLVTEVCNKAIDNELVEPNDFIDPTYANSRLKEIEQGYISKKNTNDNTISPTITTAISNYGVCVEVPLKRGYSVEVKEESPDTTEIDIIGNYSKSDYNATPIVGKNGIAPTVRENHGQVTAVTEKDKSLFTETQAKMFTEDGNVRRYVGSDIVDEFKEGQCADISFPNGYNKGQRVHDECPTINTTTTASSFVVKVPPLRIRKLTPYECYALMGFSHEDFNKSQSVPTSNTQLYRQAGNSIVVDVLEEIFCMMLDEEDNLLV